MTSSLIEVMLTTGIISLALAIMILLTVVTRRKVISEIEETSNRYLAYKPYAQNINIFRLRVIPNTASAWKASTNSTILTSTNMYLVGFARNAMCLRKYLTPLRLTRNNSQNSRKSIDNCPISRRHLRHGYTLCWNAE